MNVRMARYQGEIPPRWDEFWNALDRGGWTGDPFQVDAQEWRDRMQLLDPEPHRVPGDRL